jgi:hypothetical protein
MNLFLEDVDLLKVAKAPNKNIGVVTLSIDKQSVLNRVVEQAKLNNKHIAYISLEDMFIKARYNHSGNQEDIANYIVKMINDFLYNHPMSVKIINISYRLPYQIFDKVLRQTTKNLDFRRADLLLIHTGQSRGGGSNYNHYIDMSANIIIKISKCDYNDDLKCQIIKNRYDSIGTSFDVKESISTKLNKLDL